METHKRRQAILALLQETGEVEINSLAPRFGVSGNSIRNDLDALAEQGLLLRVRGGAVASPGPALPSYALSPSTLQPGRAEREAIARWAAGLVRDGDAVVLDDSGNALQLASLLTVRRNLTVVTNGLDAALLLAQNPTNRVILAANTVSPDGRSLSGSLNPELLNGFLAARAFVSCAGFAPDQGLTEPDAERAAIKAQMCRLARQVIALVDHSQFGHISTFRSLALAQVDHLVTDRTTAPADLAALRRAATFPVTVVGPGEAETFPPSGPAVALRRYRIGFGNLTERMVFARQVREGLERAAHSLEHVELLLRDNDMNREFALANADWFVGQRVDLVIEYQIDEEAAPVIMDKFQRAGIPVIAVDIPLPGATFFGADNYRAGRLAGEGLGYWVRAHWDGRVDRVLKIESRRAGPVPGARLQGQLEGLVSVIGPVPDDCVRAVDSSTSMEDVPLLVSAVLPDIPLDAHVAILGLNDDAALGALAVFERAGRLGQVAAVGQNLDLLGRAALRRSSYPFVGSTSFGPESYGERLLDLALRLLRSEPVPPAVYCRHAFVTRDNLDQYYPQDSEVATIGGVTP